MVTQMALITFNRSQARQKYINRGKKLEVRRMIMREAERNRGELRVIRMYYIRVWNCPRTNTLKLLFKRLKDIYSLTKAKPRNSR